ncbi:MAG: bis(5'-nucleosyl)-tetraphosphatase (symmetrical) YqeK [Blautia sp.]|nr:bis(5'-nucleosyl)-tetraphosphatase (symmetrical) YqeK [Blautia sp.]
MFQDRKGEDAVYDLVKLQKKVEKELDEDRFYHTLGVMYMCAALAMVHGVDVNVAQCAGLLHDCAKCIPTKKKLKICHMGNVPLTEFEEAHPFLIHAKLGAYLALHKYGVRDEEILSSITYHTTGKPEMTTLEKIVYIADYIEPMRFKAPNLAEVRKLAFEDLDECMYVILKNILEYLGDDPGDVDQTSIRAYAYYRNLHYARRAEKFEGRTL